MPSAAVRSPRIRAMEKLQTILSRGWRSGAKGYDHFFWRDGFAVLRSAYDMGASREGGLLLELGPKNRITRVFCDDAGPSWDCAIDNSKHWVAINTWATRVLNSPEQARFEPMPAEQWVEQQGVWAQPQARSNLLLRAMMQDQWRTRRGLAALEKRFFPLTLTSHEWQRRAGYFSEALNTDKRMQALSFEHRGQTLDARHLLAWLVVLTFEMEAVQASLGTTDGTQTIGRSYTHAKMVRRAEKPERPYYDWHLVANPDDTKDLFSGPCRVRVVLEQEHGPFSCVQTGKNIRAMSSDARIACTKIAYDMAMGIEPFLDDNAAFALDCERLSCINAGVFNGPYNSAEVKQALCTIIDEWWCQTNTRGSNLLAAIEAVYPWSTMKTSKATEAFSLLVHMAQASLSPPFMEQHLLPNDAFDSYC